MNAIAQDSDAFPTTEEMAELEWMIGKWDWKGEWFPNDPSERSPLHFIMDCDWLFGKTIIECDFFLPHSPDDLYQREVYSYDTLNKNYVVAAFIGRGFGTQPVTGNLIKHGESWVMQAEFIMPERKSFDQMVKTPEGDTFTVEQYQSMNGSMMKKVQESVVTKTD